MSDEIEAAGALATAGLVATQAPVSGGAHGHAHGGACANCGTTLSGAFCAACGQSAHVHRSLLHLAEEVLHGVLHFDAKGWRTLPLLVLRPGLLTRRYIDGQRVRYVSPLALFLFSVFLMFFVFSLTSKSPVKIGVDAEVAAASRADLVSELDQAKAAVARSEAALADAQRGGQGVAKAQEALESAREDQHTGQVALDALDAALAKNPAGPATSGLGARADAAIQHARDNPELTFYKLKSTAYKFSFMLVPISLPFLWLMFFWRRGIAMYDHAVFALYSLSFMSVLFILVALLVPVKADVAIATLLLVAAPAHMFMQLKEAYALGVLAALWRTLVLLVVCAIVLVLFCLLIVAVTMG